MFKDLFQIYKIGKELGLNKKEIKSIFLFNNTKHGILYTILLIISIIAFGVLVIFLGIQVSRNLYPAGTLYSTVKKKDFAKKSEIN